MSVFHREPTELDRREAALDCNSQDDDPQEFMDELPEPASKLAPGTMVTIFDDFVLPDENGGCHEQVACEVQKTVFAQLYDVDEVNPLVTFKDSCDEFVLRRIKGLAKEMIDLGGERAYCAVPEDISALATDLRGQFPNFTQVVDYLESHLILSTLNRRVYFPPLLLEGPPGVGKTYFAKTLANLLHTSYLEVHFESAQNGSALSGSSEFWSNTQQGELFNTLVRGQYFNPLVVVDEVDKCGSDARFDPMSSLYQLLEPETAKCFRDESVRRVALDASGVMWVLTANDVSRLPAPILSRVTVLRVENPDYEQCKGIVRQIHASVLESMALSGQFENALSDEVVACLATRAPREMKSTIVSALALAAVSGRRSLMPKDIITTARPSKRIGFVH